MPRKTNGNPASTRKKKAVSAVLSVPPAEEVRKAAQNRGMEDEIRRRAYEIYLERNGSAGDEHQDWLIAEREVLARHQHGHSA